MYRLSLEYVRVTPHWPIRNGSHGFWKVHRCRKMNQWADRVVDVDRRDTPKLRLRLLSWQEYGRGDVVDPRKILNGYWGWRNRETET